MFHADIAPSRANRLVKGIFVGSDAEVAAICRTEPLNAVLIQKDFTHRAKGKTISRVFGSLGHGVEGPDPFQLVTKKIEANW